MRRYQSVLYSVSVRWPWRVCNRVYGVHHLVRPDMSIEHGSTLKISVGKMCNRVQLRATIRTNKLIALIFNAKRDCSCGFDVAHRTHTQLFGQCRFSNEPVRR